VIAFGAGTFDQPGLFEQFQVMRQQVAGQLELPSDLAG
jgi:hypothetical protein